MRKEANKKEIKVFYIFLRYLFLVLISIPNLALFYLIFTPLTIYPVNFLLNFFYSSYVEGNIIYVEGIRVWLVEACIAGSAYYLLLLLNFSTPMKAKKRLCSVIFSFSTFLGINILRIFIFIILFINSFRYFDITHRLFWYLLSGIIVFLVWLLTIKIFKIKDVPFYTDIKFITSLRKKSH